MTPRKEFWGNVTRRTPSVRRVCETPECGRTFSVESASSPQRHCTSACGRRAKYLRKRDAGA